MAFHPAPVDLMPQRGRLQALPQLAVLYRIAASRLPVLADPARHPLGQTLPHILRIGIEHDVARLGQRLQPGNGRHQLHPVVGGVRLATAQFALVPLVAQQRRPATGAGIAEAGTVGVDFDGFQYNSRIR